MPKRRISLICACYLLLGFGLAFLRAGSLPRHPQKADVEVISNPKTPVPPAGKRKSLVFKEELSIGRREGDENYMFGSSVSLNTDEVGNFYVTDWDKKKILKYDPSGKYLLTIGRQGQGPGEFQNLSVARFDKEGNIYVTDLASRRISFFDKGGNYLRQIVIPDVFEDLYLTARGYYVASRSVRMESDAGMAFKLVDGFFNDKFELVIELYSRVLDTKFPAGWDSTGVAKFTAGLISGMAFRPTPRHLVAANETIYFGYAQDYAIDVYSPDGLKMKTLRKAYEPIKIRDSDKAHFEDTIARPFMTRTGGPTRSENEIRDVLKFIEYPDNKPAYQSFALMENGWLVVLVEIVPKEYSLFDLFDERGLYIGQFKADFPADYGLFFFKNGKAYAVETDDEGYKFVKRYSVKIEDY